MPPWGKKFYNTLVERLNAVNFRQPPYSTRYPDLLTIFEKNQPMPDFTWEGLTDGVFKVMPVKQKPVEVKLWTATNQSGRDFREITGILWTSSVLEANADGSYAGTVTRPEQGSTAFYIGLTYRESEDDPLFTLATPITVLVP